MPRVSRGGIRQKGEEGGRRMDRLSHFSTIPPFQEAAPSALRLTTPAPPARRLPASPAGWRESRSPSTCTAGMRRSAWGLPRARWAGSRAMCGSR